MEIIIRTCYTNSIIIIAWCIIIQVWISGREDPKAPTSMKPSYYTQWYPSYMYMYMHMYMYVTTCDSIVVYTHSWTRVTIYSLKVLLQPRELHVHVHVHVRFSICSISVANKNYEISGYMYMYMYMYATLSVHILNTHNLWAIFNDFFEKVLSLFISLSRSSLIMINSHIPARTQGQGRGREGQRTEGMERKKKIREGGREGRRVQGKLGGCYDACCEIA